ncbi:glycosyltransferase family 2 protein [Psychroflexus sp. MBR-150]
MNLTYIIIVSYNASPWLKKCLGSIDFDKFKVIVVDNNSKDDTTSVIEEKYPQIKLFKEDTNLGFGQANNKGISYALNQGADQVFLLNQDAYLVDDCIDKLLLFQQNNPEYGILSPIHTNASLTKLDRNFSNYVRYDMNPDFYSDHVLGNELKPVYEVPFVNAAGWLIRKECLMRVGGFDPLFFHYGEDDNFCQRVRFHDFKIGVLPQVFMIHDREDRKKDNIKPYSDAFFNKKTRSFKIKYANVLTHEINVFDSEIKRLKRQILKFKLKGKFSYAQANTKFLKSLPSLKQSITKSYKVNQHKGAHYLNLNSN